MQKTLLGSIAVLTLFAALLRPWYRGGNKKVHRPRRSFRTSEPLRRRCPQTAMRDESGARDFSIGLDWRGRASWRIPRAILTGRPAGAARDA